MAAAVGQLFQRYNVKILAPRHGNIIGQNVDHYMELLQEGMRQAAAI